MDKQFGIIVGLFQLINIGAKGNDIDVVVIANGLHQVIDDDVVAAIAVVIAVVITVVMVAVRVITAVVVLLFTNAESYHGDRPVFPAVVVFNGNVFCFALYAVCKVLRASKAFRFYLVCFVLCPKRHIRFPRLPGRQCGRFSRLCYRRRILHGRVVPG